MTKKPIIIFDVISGLTFAMRGTIDELYEAAEELRSLAFGLDYITVETYYDFLDNKFNFEPEALKQSFWWRKWLASAKLKTDRIMVRPMWHPEWKEICYSLYR